MKIGITCFNLRQRKTNSLVKVMVKEMIRHRFLKAYILLITKFSDSSPNFQQMIAKTLI